MDLLSTPIWSDYIRFVKNYKTSTPIEDSVKMEQLRKLYQRAVVNPMQNLECKAYPNHNYDIVQQFGRNMMPLKMGSTSFLQKIYWRNTLRNICKPGSFPLSSLLTSPEPLIEKGRIISMVFNETCWLDPQDTQLGRRMLNKFHSGRSSLCMRNRYHNKCSSLTLSRTPKNYHQRVSAKEFHSHTINVWCASTTFLKSGMRQQFFNYPRTESMMLSWCIGKVCKFI